MPRGVSWDQPQESQPQNQNQNQAQTQNQAQAQGQPQNQNQSQPENQNQPQPEGSPEQSAAELAPAEPGPDPADITTPVDTVEGERSPRQFGPLPPGTRRAVEAAAAERRFWPGQDVTHDEFGSGWVQGSGVGRVTVRFESPWTGPGVSRPCGSTIRLSLVRCCYLAREAFALLVGHARGPGVSIGSMTDEATKTEVVDNELDDRFEIWFGDQLAGFAAYRRRGGATVFVHTKIESEFEGKGLASVLARRALDATVARGEAIIPVCPFIAAYLRKHPDYEEHVRWPAADASSSADTPASGGGEQPQQH